MNQIGPYNETTQEQAHNKISEIIDCMNSLIIAVAELRAELDATKNKRLFSRSRS